MQRINGIGRIFSSSLVLTHEVTKACGHLLEQGNDGGDAARRYRDRVAKAAQEHADKTGRSVAVYATRRGGGPWVVDVIYPKLTNMGYMQQRGAA